MSDLAASALPATGAQHDDRRRADLHDPAVRRALLADAAARANRFLDGLAERSVAPKPEAVRALAGWDTPMPDGPGDPHEVLARLDELGSPATLGIAGP